MSSEYPGANYDVEELNQQGFTGRRRGPLYAANIARLVGPKSAAGQQTQDFGASPSWAAKIANFQPDFQRDSR